MLSDQISLNGSKSWLYYLIFINIFFACYALTQPYSGHFLLGTYLVESGILGFIALLEIGRLAKTKQEFIKPISICVLFGFTLFGLIFMSFWFIGAAMGYVSYDAEPGVFQNILGFINHIFLPIIGFILLIEFVLYLVRRTMNSVNTGTSYIEIIMRLFWRILFIFFLIMLFAISFQEDEGLRVENSGYGLSITLLAIFSITKIAFDVLEYRHSTTTINKKL